MALPEVPEVRRRGARRVPSQHTWLALLGQSWGGSGEGGGDEEGEAKGKGGWAGLRGCTHAVQAASCTLYVPSTDARRCGGHLVGEPTAGRAQLRASANVMFLQWGSHALVENTDALGCGGLRPGLAGQLAARCEQGASARTKCGSALAFGRNVRTV